MRYRTILGAVAGGVLILSASGCAISALSTIASRITSAKNPSALAPSIPTDDTVELLDQSIAFGDPKIEGALASGALKGLIATSSTGVATISPAPFAIPAVKFGQALANPISFSSVLPAQAFSIPPFATTIPQQSTTVDVGSVELTLSGFGTETLKNIQSNPLSAGLTLPTALVATASTPLPAASIPGVQDVIVKTGSLQIPVKNGSAGTLDLSLNVTDSAGRDLGTQSLSSLASGNTGNLDFPFASNQEITPPLTLTVNSTVSIAQGTAISGIPDSESLTFGPSAISLTPSSGNVQIATQSLPLATASIPISTQIPSGSLGVSPPFTVTASSGVMSITIDNGMPLVASLSVNLSGISGVNQAQVVTAAGQQTIAVTQNPDGTITVPFIADATSSGALGGVTVLDLPLAGGSIGDVAASISAETEDTGSNDVTVSNGDSLSVSTKLSSLEIQSVEAGDLATTSVIPTQVEPLNLPAQFSQTGISPGAVSVAITLNNQSQLAGDFGLTISGTSSAGAVENLTAKDGTPFPAQAFAGVAAGSTPGATQSTTLLIDQNNSNILQLLEDGVSSLAIGGSVQIDDPNVTISSADQIGGQVSIAIPLSLIIPPMGPGLAHPAFDIQPPMPVSLSGQNTSTLTQALQSAELDFTVTNGWQFPMTLHILLSTTSDPYNDTNAIVRTLSLGSGSPTESSIQLTSQQVALLPNLKTVGIQITSTGTNGAISILPTDTLDLQVKARVVAQLSTSLLTK